MRKRLLYFFGFFILQDSTHAELLHELARKMEWGSIHTILLTISHDQKLCNDYLNSLDDSGQTVLDIISYSLNENDSFYILMQDFGALRSIGPQTLEMPDTKIPYQESDNFEAADKVKPRDSVSGIIQRSTPKRGRRERKSLPTSSFITTSKNMTTACSSTTSTSQTEQILPMSAQKSLQFIKSKIDLHEKRKLLREKERILEREKIEKLAREATQKDEISKEEGLQKILKKELKKVHNLAKMIEENREKMLKIVQENEITITRALELIGKNLKINEEYILIKAHKEAQRTASSFWISEEEEILKFTQDILAKKQLELALDLAAENALEKGGILRSLVNRAISECQSSNSGVVMEEDFNSNTSRFRIVAYRVDNTSKVFLIHLDQIIGEGTEGRIYLAHELTSQEDNNYFENDVLIVKSWRSPSDHGKAARREALLTAKATKKFDSHYIRGTFFEKNHIYIFMNYGGIPISALPKNLADSIKDEIALGILIAAKRVHDRSLLHRDFKPANFLLQINPVTGLLEVIAIDFGESCRMRDYGREIVGTPSYSAPESNQERKEDCLPATLFFDLFSMGLTLSFISNYSYEAFQEEKDRNAPFLASDLKNACPDLYPDENEKARLFEKNPFRLLIIETIHSLVHSDLKRRPTPQELHQTIGRMQELMKAQREYIPQPEPEELTITGSDFRSGIRSIFSSKSSSPRSDSSTSPSRPNSSIHSQNSSPRPSTKAPQTPLRTSPLRTWEQKKANIPVFYLSKSDTTARRACLKIEGDNTTNRP
jgi:serine/threonine protein kinase